MILGKANSLQLRKALYCGNNRQLNTEAEVEEVNDRPGPNNSLRSR